MTILDRYIAWNLAQSWLLLFTLFAVVFGLFAFIDELNHTTASYQANQALLFVLLTTPQRTLELFPVIALLGTLISYAMLARSNELVAIQTFGITAARQFLSAALPATLLMFLLWPLGEYIAGPLFQQADAARHKARNGTAHVLGEAGLWSTDGDVYYHIGSLNQALAAEDVSVYRFDTQGRLTSALQARQGEIIEGRSWRLQAAQTKDAITDPETGGYRLVTSTKPTLVQEGLWSKAEITSLSLPTSSMTLRALREYLTYLKTTGQNQGTLRHQFWQRAILPIMTAVMVLLAFQLSHGMLRHREQNFGTQLAIGIAISLFFYLLSQIIYAAGTLIHFDPRLVATLPVVLVLSAALWLHFYRP